MKWGVFSLSQVPDLSRVPAAFEEDFSYFQEKVPGLYFFVGAKPESEPYIQPLNGHHTPDFILDEAAMLTGVKAMLNLTLDFMEMNK